MARRAPEDFDRELGALGRRKPHRPQRLAFSPGGMVSTAHHRATEAGRRMLEEGGNAIDAAVAAAFALGVCEPQASGLGGQTLMLIHLAVGPKTFALDGSSMAPNRATPDEFGKGQRFRGYRAFLGTDGISLDFGPTSVDIDSAHIVTLAARHAKECILMADSSKFDQPSLYKIADFRSISTIITEKRPSERWTEYFEEKQINVIYPDENIND